MKYALKQLQKLNLGRCEPVDDKDLEIVNNIIQTIEDGRGDFPMPGDIVQYTNKYGSFYSHAHIEYMKDGKFKICEQGTPSFATKYNKEVGFSMSGGVWREESAKNKFKHAGTSEKYLWTWGRVGACGNGGIYFRAQVNVWRYTAHKPTKHFVIQSKTLTNKETLNPYKCDIKGNVLNWKTVIKCLGFALPGTKNIKIPFEKIEENIKKIGKELFPVMLDCNSTKFVLTEPVKIEIIKK